MNELDKILNALPQELQPSAEAIADLLKDISMENLEEVIDAVVLGNTEEAYQDMLRGLPTSRLLDSLQVINANMAQIADRHRRLSSYQQIFFKELISLGLTHLKKEITKDG